MKQIRPLFQPPPASGSLESGPVILRDGTTASLRPTRAEDRAMMQRLHRSIVTGIQASSVLF